MTARTMRFRVRVEAPALPLVGVDHYRLSRVEYDVPYSEHVG